MVIIGGAWKLGLRWFCYRHDGLFSTDVAIGINWRKNPQGISEYFQDPYKASLIDKGQIPSLKEIAHHETDRASR